MLYKAGEKEFLCKKKGRCKIMRRPFFLPFFDSNGKTLGFEFYGSSVSHYLGGSLHNGGGGIADIDDGIGLQTLCLFFHTLGCQCSGGLHHFRIRF